MRICAIMLALLPMVSCGVNEVIIRIEGGDGNKVRLDADEVQPRFNRLVDAGSVPFGDVREGTYAIRVVTNQQVMSDTVKVEPAPITGVRSYGLTVTIPGGHNGGYQPRGTILYASTPVSVRAWDLYTIPAAGGEPTRITDTPEFEQYPAWSPDGREIAFSRGHVTTNIDIYVMAADGSTERRLTEHPERDEQPAWSPDGGTIAFLSHRDGDVGIWLMDADGGNKRKLVPGREPAWSPDGKQIAFTSGHYDGNDEIYVVDADGSNLRRLTFDPHYDWHAAWSPEGHRLAFNSERFGGEELMLADVGSGRQVRVTVAKHTFEQDPSLVSGRPRPGLPGEDELPGGWHAGRALQQPDRQVHPPRQLRHLRRPRRRLRLGPRRGAAHHADQPHQHPRPGREVAQVAILLIHTRAPGPSAPAAPNPCFEGAPADSTRPDTLSALPGILLGPSGTLSYLPLPKEEANGEPDVGPAGLPQAAAGGCGGGLGHRPGVEHRTARGRSPAGGAQTALPPFP